MYVCACVSAGRERKGEEWGGGRNVRRRKEKRKKNKKRNGKLRKKTTNPIYAWQWVNACPRRKQLEYTFSNFHFISNFLDALMAQPPLLRWDPFITGFVIFLSFSCISTSDVAIAPVAVERVCVLLMSRLVSDFLHRHSTFSHVSSHMFVVL